MKIWGLTKSLIQVGDNRFVLYHRNWSCALSHSKSQNCDCTLLQVISSFPCTTENKDFLGNKTDDQAAYIFTISDFDGGVHSGYGLTDIDAVWPVRWIKTFWRYTLRPSSGLRITQEKCPRLHLHIACGEFVTQIWFHLLTSSCAPSMQRAHITDRNHNQHLNSTVEGSTFLQNAHIQQ